jgi:hypothetical protein
MGRLRAHARGAGSAEDARELRHRRSQAHLHGAERRRRPVRDLGLVEPVPERVADDGVLLGRQRVERVVHAMVVASQVFELVGRRHGGGHEIGGGVAERPGGPRARPQAIDGAAARDRHHPGDGAASTRVELRGALPQLEEGLLHDVLGVVRSAEDARGDGRRALGVAVEQGADRLNLAVGHAREELSISLPLLLRRERGGRRRREGSWGRSAHDRNVATPWLFATSISPSLAGDERAGALVTPHPPTSTYAPPATRAPRRERGRLTSNALARTVKR